MDTKFVRLDLLANTSTYYGPLKYNLTVNVSECLNSNSTPIIKENLNFTLNFENFTDPIPNTIDEIINTFPQIKTLLEKINIQDEIIFNVKLNAWSIKNAHLVTFGQDRYSCVFGDTQIITVKKLKQYYKIEDQTEAIYKKITLNVNELFESNASQEYLLVKKRSESESDIVSNYLYAYKLIFSNTFLDEFILNINFIITDIVAQFDTTHTIHTSHAIKEQILLGSTYTTHLKCDTIEQLTLENITQLFDIKKYIFIPISNPGSDNFKNYLNQMEKLKNYSKYKQIDDIIDELKFSKESVYKSYFMDAVNNLIINTTNEQLDFMEKIDLDGINYSEDDSESSSPSASSSILG